MQTVVCRIFVGWHTNVLSITHEHACIIFCLQSGNLSDFFLLFDPMVLTAEAVCTSQGL